MNKIREVIVYKSYFDDFFSKLLTGFHKKTQKTPKVEIEWAERLMKEYYNDKKNDKKNGSTIIRTD